MRIGLAASVTAALIARVTPGLAAETTLDLGGEVPNGPERHFSVEFDVPAGTKEIAVHQKNLVDGNILDFGIMDSTGTWRGWGGSRIQDAVVGEQAATRSHVPGPIPAGKWSIVIGEAAVNVLPATFELTVTLRDAPTLPAQPERKPYAPVAALSPEARWYAGDFHVHSIESNDAEPSLDTIATFARGRGLDFAHISDHNTHTQLDYFADAQAKHSDFLFVPGAEYTTYWGHASAVGATEWVDDRTELPGWSIAQAVEKYHQQGAFFSINHPTLTVGDLCIGCAWEHDLPVEALDGVEIGTGKFGVLTDSAVELWDDLSNQGRHLVALGGSDDHRAGEGTGISDSPIGNPTTMVFATELSVKGIMDGVRAGRTVVKLGGPDDAMIDLKASVPPDGDTIHARSARLEATVTGGAGKTVRWVKNGEEQEDVSVDADPFVLARDVKAPASGEDRWRVEVLESGKRRTVTSHVWITAVGATGAEADESDDGGCGCNVPNRSSLGWSVLLALALLAVGRRRDRR